MLGKTYKSHGHRTGRRQAFTLLEVVLALAILAVSLAALGEVLRLASDNSTHARDVTQAQLIAATKLSELTSGATQLAPVDNAAVEDVIADPPWRYSVEIGEAPEIGLVPVRVTVRQDMPQNQRPATYFIVRWMPDPTVLTSSASTSSTGGTSSGSTSSTSGGAR